MDKQDYLNIKSLNNTLPKFLGDLWESVAAAIIIDGGYILIIYSYKYIFIDGRVFLMFMVECTNPS